MERAPIELMRVYRRVLSTFFVLALVAVAACSEDPPPLNDSARENPAAPTAEAILPFLDFRPADTRGVQLPRVEGALAEPGPVAVFGGRATLRGTVDFPGAVVDDLEIPAGAVPAATVQLERFVGGTVGIERIAVGPTGRWEARDIKGGRYRVRAWIDDWFGEPLELADAVTLFLTEGEDRELPLTLDIAEPPYIGEVTVYLSTDPQPAPLGADTKLVIRITTTFNQGAPDELILPLVAYEVELLEAPNWDVIGTRTFTTDDEGVIELEARCNASPGSPFVFLLNDTRYESEAPPCEAVEGPEPVDFDIGDHFEPPFEGPLPAGEYEAMGGDTDCEVTYEPWAEGEWDEPVTVEGPELVLDTPGRNFEAPDDATCRYRRVA